MEQIIIQSMSKEGDVYHLQVELAAGEKRRMYDVTVQEEYFQKLAHGDMTPEQLVKKSFVYLLSKEPSSAILRTFDLSVIQQYFPDYEATIMGQKL